jgi:hypothetical protein
VGQRLTFADGLDIENTTGTMTLGTTPCKIIMTDIDHAQQGRDKLKGSAVAAFLGDSQAISRRFFKCGDGATLRAHPSCFALSRRPVYWDKGSAGEVL